MIRATKAGHFHAPVADVTVLDHQQRRQRQAIARTVAGLEFQIDLGDAPTPGRGDCYVLEDGRLIEIIAAPEELMEVRGKDALHITRLAYQLGKQQLECEITAKFIRLRRDARLADALRHSGGKVLDVNAPFHPESEPASQHNHAHAPHDHAHNHTHGDDCGCDHDHGHKHEHDHKHGH